MMKAILTLALAGAALGAATVSQALACACCSSRGQRLVDTVPLSGDVLSELQQMSFAPKAQLFMGEADPTAFEGRVEDTQGRYTVSVSLTAGRMTFHFLDDETKRKGTLAFALPKTLTRFEIDPRSTPDEGLGPLLYKEWRLTGPATGSGIFAPGMSKGPKMTLIYQGSGRGCTSAADFTDWTLVVHGRNDQYHLFGTLKNRR